MKNSLFFEHIIQKINSAKNKADTLAKQADHRGIEGAIREIALKECIEPFLTESFRVNSGKIIDSEGNQSRQVDLIIYRKKLIPPILISPELGFFPVESVKYAIEVKSKVTSSNLKDCIENFKSIQNLKSYPKSMEHPLPVTVLFGFDSDINSSDLTRLSKNIYKNSPLTTVCILGKGYWLFDQKNQNFFGKDTRKSEKKFSEFCNFITGLMNTLSQEELTFRHFYPGIYVNPDPSID